MECCFCSCVIIKIIVILLWFYCYTCTFALCRHRLQNMPVCVFVFMTSICPCGICFNFYIILVFHKGKKTYALFALISVYLWFHLISFFFVLFVVVL